MGNFEMKNLAIYFDTNDSCLGRKIFHYNGFEEKRQFLAKILCKSSKIVIKTL
jgi:hypothetical protein